MRSGLRRTVVRRTLILSWLLPDLPLLSLAVVPSTPSTILVGTQGAGAYSLTR